MNSLIQTYTDTPNLREDQDYNYIEKTILSGLHEQKVSFKQAKEIFRTIKRKIQEQLENETIRIQNTCLRVCAETPKILYGTITESSLLFISNTKASLSANCRYFATT